jgi:hypothetical protein
MIRYECDKCGARMRADDPKRFIVRMEVFAAADHMDLQPHVAVEPREELDRVLRDLASADPDHVEDRTYRAFRFDLCDACRQKVLSCPLG